MFIQPELGRLLARTKIEEAQCRIARAQALHADSLDRQREPVGPRSPSRRSTRPAPRPATTSR